MQAEPQNADASIPGRACSARAAAAPCRCCMNAGLMADLPSLESSGARGVGLFRNRAAVSHLHADADAVAGLSALYLRACMDAAQGKRVCVPHARLSARHGSCPTWHARTSRNPASRWAGDPRRAGTPGVIAADAAPALPARRPTGVRLSVMFALSSSSFDEYPRPLGGNGPRSRSSREQIPGHATALR